MRRALLLTVVVATLLGAAFVGPASVAAQERGSVVGGVRFQEDESHVFAYGEVNLGPDLSIGLHWYDKVVGVSTWFGRDKGFYGQVRWNSDRDESPHLWELGVWSEFSIAENVDLWAWVGLLSEWNGSRTWLSVNAEAQIPIGDPLFLSVGAETYVTASDNSAIAPYVGIGFRF